MHPFFRPLGCIALLFALATLLQPVVADCRDCCSPEDRPFCCPRGATCVQKGSSRYACRFAEGAGGSKAGQTAPYSPDYVQREVPTCGFGCALALTLAFCFCLPCCVIAGYQIHQYRRRQSEAAEAGSMGGWGAPPPPTYPPPVNYAATTYGSGVVGGGGEPPRAPPNSPATGYGPPPGEKWEGPAYRMADVEGRPYAKEAYPAASTSGAYPTIARSPPPRTGGPTTEMSSSDKGKAWLSSSAGGHAMADPEIVRPTAHAPPPSSRAVAAPGEAGVRDEEAVPPPPPYAPR